MKMELSLADLQQRALMIGDRLPYLRLLVLFGSRATGKAKNTSDWDFAALYDEEIRHAIANSENLSLLNIYSYLTNILDLPAEKVEIVKLNACSPAIAHVVARDGLLVYEKEIGEFERFRVKSLLSQEDLQKFRKQRLEALKVAAATWRQKYGS